VDLPTKLKAGQPTAHVQRLAQDLLDLPADELQQLRKECIKRMSVKPDTTPPGLQARSPFPHPAHYFCGQPNRSLPFAPTVFQPGIHVPNAGLPLMLHALSRAAQNQEDGDVQKVESTSAE